MLLTIAEINTSKRKLMLINIMGVKLWNQSNANVHNVKTTNILST